MLRARGYDAHNMEGGMQAWEGEGLPFSAVDGGPGQVAEGSRGVGARAGEASRLEDVLVSVAEAKDAVVGLPGDRVRPAASAGGSRPGAGRAPGRLEDPGHPKDPRRPHRGIGAAGGPGDQGRRVAARLGAASAPAVFGRRPARVLIYPPRFGLPAHAGHPRPEAFEPPAASGTKPRASSPITARSSVSA